MKEIKFFRDPKKLESYRNELEETRGYTSLRLVGGTSKDGKYSCFGNYEYYHPIFKEKYCLVVLYKDNYYMDHPSDDKRISEFETLLETLLRELKEETNIIIPPESVHICKNKLGIDEKNHKKYFFYCNNLEKYWNHVGSYFPENKGEISTPFFVKKTLLKTRGMMRRKKHQDKTKGMKYVLYAGHHYPFFD